MFLSFLAGMHSFIKLASVLKERTESMISVGRHESVLSRGISNGVGVLPRNGGPLLQPCLPLPGQLQDPV